jgi:hypothetical protein
MEKMMRPPRQRKRERHAKTLHREAAHDPIGLVGGTLPQHLTEDEVE